jgi:hypothetical protein
MNLDRLGLMFFINYFNQIDSVKKHLTNSLRELLLAMSSTLDIVQQTAERNRVFNRIDIAAMPIKRIDALLQFAVQRLAATPAPATPDTRRLKEHVVESIISVIDEEIDSLSSRLSPRNQLKIEALGTVKQVLRGHLNIDDQADFDAVEGDEDLIANMA